MSLVPNGRFRLMVAQTVGRNDPNNNGAGVAAAPPGTAPAPRNDVQQEQLGAGGMAGAEQAPTPEPGTDGSGVPSQMGGQPAEGLSIEPVSDEQQQGKPATRPETNLKAHVFKVLETIGVPPRQLTSIPDVFGQEIDFDTHTISGHYLIPTYVAKGELDEGKAAQIAQQIGQQFGLSQKMKLEHRNNHTNWRVTFTTMPKQTIQQNGTSFDGLQNQNNPQKGAAKAASNAFTMGEMIKARRDDLYDIMRKIANRSENDPQS